MTDFSFKKVCFTLAKSGYGSYIEIFNEWDLDDYDHCMQTIIKENKQYGRQ